MKKTACFVVFWLVLATPLFAQWMPPAGVPRPGFGIDEKPPEPTLYVADTGSDTNPGTLAKPRRTIPTRLAAGTVVSVSGSQGVFTSPNAIIANGTKEQPVYILGGTFTGEVQLIGSYVIVQNAVSKGGWYVNGSNIVFRDSEFIGGGVALVQWLGTGSPTNIVVLRGNFHDIGSAPATWPTGGDADSHGVGVGHHSSYVWVLDSTFARVSGDSVQVNGEAFGALTHHIYVGRTRSDQNRQSGGWAKQSQDVVFSENTVTRMRNVDGLNPGNGLGAQYQALRVVFIKNTISDCDYGIRIGGDTDGPFGVLVAGNILKNIHSPQNSAQNPQSPGGAIVFTNNGDRVAAFNTISDVDTGIGIANSGGSVAIIGNTFASVKREGVYETPKPVFSGDLEKVSAGYQQIHGVPLGVDFSGAPTTTPVPPPPVVPPVKPPLPACPHTWLGALGYLAGRCQW